MIRGAIAFGLVLRIDGSHFLNRDVIVTTSLTLVVLTTIIYGSTVGVLSRFLFPEDEEQTPKLLVEEMFDENQEKSPRK